MMSKKSVFKSLSCISSTNWGATHTAEAIRKCAFRLGLGSHHAPHG